MPFKFFNWLNRDKTAVVIVSGLPRSGTSMMMKMLEAGGLEILTDFQRTPDENNPKGYYEFERVKKLKDGDTDWVIKARGKVVKVITALLEHLPDTENYHIILMRRDMTEILASQRRMLERDGMPDDNVDDATMAALYEKHLHAVYKWLQGQKNVRFIEVSYNDVITHPRPSAVGVNAFLEAGLDVDKMTAIVDDSLYRERGK